jgi:hypothetical protein
MRGYPPGCSYNDADSPENEVWEDCMDELAGMNFDPVLLVRIIKAIAPLMTETMVSEWKEGYQQGKDDAWAKWNDQGSDRDPNEDPFI